MPQPLWDVFRIQNFNDTFALGHYARVMDATDRRTGRPIALKVLRPEHLQDNDVDRWEPRAFINEANLLMKLVDSPYMVNMLDCGYVSGAGEAPTQGDVASFGLDALGYASSYRQYVSMGWRPYIALENLPRHHNLLYLMKPTVGGARRRLPSEEGLALALQFTELMRTAHRQNIVYLDHKLEHIYWDGTRLQVIDMNSSRLLDGDANLNAQHIAGDIHNLCVGILYPVFTGMSSVHGSLRPSPGGAREVESRYADVTALDFGIEPMLSPAIIDLLQRGAARQFTSVEQFQQELQMVAAQHGWDFPESYTSPASREARDQMRAGLKRIREGETLLREARDLFREAAIQEHITPDLEDELRRLVMAVNDALNHRVIP
jgi:serine/threonine protein kinase